MLSGLTGKNHERLQLGHMPSSMVVAVTQLGMSHSLQWPHLCSTMLLLTQTAALPAGQIQAQGCGQLNDSSNFTKCEVLQVCPVHHGCMQRDPWG